METKKYSSKLEGARVLVIGGTSGMGFCVAEAALEYGAIVTVASSTQPKLDKTVERLQTAYPHYKENIKSVRCDLMDVANLDATMENILKAAAGGDSASNKVDHIVYTASPPIDTPLLPDITVDGILRGGNARVAAALILAKHALHWMPATLNSSFTMTSGTMADKPNNGWVIGASYNSASFGMTRALALEMKPVRVNTVVPGLVNTELLQDMNYPEDLLEAMRNMALTQTVGTPEDVAEAYIYLMRDHFTTGTVLRTDGGRMLR